MCLFLKHMQETNIIYTSILNTEENKLYQIISPAKDTEFPKIPNLYI